MAFFKIPDTFWEIFTAVTGGSTTNLTEAMRAIAQAERTKANSYFVNVIDQIPHNTEDYQRLRSFLIDLYATQRSIANYSSQLTDPRSMANEQLDELFRSFGFPFSTILRQASPEPLDSKINLFLDLVNLYKIKGTPQGLLEVLQYYGVPQLDIYSFWLRLNASGNLEFRGNVVAGTTVNPSTTTLDYGLLTSTDPHWLYTESQIKTLNQNNLINLPSKTPYIGIQPIAEIGAETAILTRKIQDQYFDYEASGDLPPQDAEITILGEVVSLLELYLSLIYTFYKEYDVGGTDGTNFVCYDGSATLVADIISEYDSIVGGPVTSRQNILDRLAQYYDKFTRQKPENFLQTRSSAEAILQVINPGLITSLDAVADPVDVVLNSLLKDLANWVRNNIGFGFVNLGFVLSGLQAFFEDLTPVINFFKPYRARLIILESLAIKNRLFNSIFVEDRFDFTTDFEFRDYITGDSKACCSNPDLGATCDSTALQYYSRATFDCGSYFDIGAATDIRPNSFLIPEIDQTFEDRFRCSFSTDSTALVQSEEVAGDFSSLGFDSTTATSVPGDPFPEYHQSGGFEPFDTGASFDCTHGFDRVEITVFPLGFFLLKEDGFRLLKEDGGRIKLESSP